MMAPVLVPADLAPPAPVVAQIERKRNDLYAPSPTRPESGVAAGFYQAYGRTITSLELDRGVRSARWLPIRRRRASPRCGPVSALAPRPGESSPLQR